VAVVPAVGQVSVVYVSPPPSVDPQWALIGIPLFGLIGIGAMGMKDWPMVSPAVIIVVITVVLAIVMLVRKW
jgi:hypothetical protein